MEGICTKRPPWRHQIEHFQIWEKKHCQKSVHDSASRNACIEQMIYWLTLLQLFVTFIRTAYRGSVERTS